jgi:hypothetical protein
MLTKGILGDARPFPAKRLSLLHYSRQSPPMRSSAFGRNHAGHSMMETAGESWGQMRMVEVSGIEPLASTLRTSRSPN